MAIAGKPPITDYIKAFAHFGGLNKVFHTRAFGRHALINDGVNVYQVSRFDDLLSDYRKYFKSDYYAIYTMFPAELWDSLLDRKVQLNSDDLIIELYKGWKTYWKGQVIDLEKQAASLTKFNEMTSQFQKNGRLLEAAEVDAPVMMPVIALTVKRQYNKSLEFLTDCAILMIERYRDQIGDGQLFVKVGPEGYPKEHTYYIYTVNEDF